MSVIIGSARSSYGNTTKGDQHGGDEVSTQSWYKHSLGWVVLRATDPEVRAKLAKAMKAACENNNIGYSQPDRLALFNQVKDKGYDPAKATKATNCDCSSLVRVCCYYAGIKPANFITSNEVSALLATGAFTKLTDSKYTTKSDYLLAGDILVTKSKGHTVIVLTNGSKAENSASNVITNVVIRGGNCYVRKQPKTSAAKIGVALKGTSYVYALAMSDDGWYKIVFKGQEGWVSGKYAKRD